MRRAQWRLVLALSLGFPLCLSLQAAECARTPYECAISFVEHQNFQDAIRFLNVALQESPHDLKSLNLLGIALTGAGRRDQPNETFKAALDVDPHFYPARKNLAINEFDRKRFAEAAVQFHRVLLDAPED